MFNVLVAGYPGNAKTNPPPRPSLVSATDCEREAQLLPPAIAAPCSGGDADRPFNRLRLVRVPCTAAGIAAAHRRLWECPARRAHTPSIFGLDYLATQSD